LARVFASVGVLCNSFINKIEQTVQDISEATLWNQWSIIKHRGDAATPTHAINLMLHY